VALQIEMRLTTLCMLSGACVLPHPSELLHLNQSCVQHFISNLTDAQASTLWY